MQYRERHEDSTNSKKTNSKKVKMTTDQEENQRFTACFERFDSRRADRTETAVYDIAAHDFRDDDAHGPGVYDWRTPVYLRQIESYAQHLEKTPFQTQDITIRKRSVPGSVFETTWQWSKRLDGALRVMRSKSDWSYWEVLQFALGFFPKPDMIATGRNLPYGACTRAIQRPSCISVGAFAGFLKPKDIVDA